MEIANGDLQKILKIFIKTAAWGFVVCGAVLFLGRSEWFPASYRTDFMGFISLLSALVIILPELWFRPDSQRRLEALLKIQAAFAFGLILNGLGTLGLFRFHTNGFGYDKFVHFIFALVLTMALINFLRSWYDFPWKKSISGSILLVALTGIGGEFLEVIFDAVFKTQTFGIYGKFKATDTILDLVYDALGIVSGTVLYLLKARQAD